ncbi:hypothetical protein [Roseibium sediminicola]|uniref:Tetratricopeptide repeat protein n=1 Tax=Roseibium sediminicola TaxID=2933272 RepID=A0ABT0H0Y2_9HYPH|nr:hypothetical protein [Roseibium sp. CAU 1639]MCK7615334.1 hypothetical protein [Roseibium sp. CAU 1639]
MTTLVFHSINATIGSSAANVLPVRPEKTPRLRKGTLGSLGVAAALLFAVSLPATAQVPDVGDGVCVAFCDDYTPPTYDSYNYGGGGGYSYQQEQMKRSNTQPSTRPKKLRPSASQRKKIKQQKQLANWRRKSVQENKKCLKAFDVLYFNTERIETLIKHCSAALDYCRKGRGNCTVDRWNMALANANKAKEDKNYADAVTYYDEAINLCGYDDDCSGVGSHSSLEGMRSSLEASRKKVAALAELQREAGQSQSRIEAAVTSPLVDAPASSADTGLSFLEADAIMPSQKATYLLDALQAGQGNWTKSLEDLEKTVRDNPDDRSARDALLYLKGLHQGHLTISKLSNARYKKGINAWMDGDYKTATDFLAESYLADPDDPSSLEAYGIVSGLAQSDLYLDWTQNCGMLKCPPPDPLHYVGEYASLLNSTAYELLNEDERERLIQARSLYSDPGADPDQRAALQYVEGLAAWDDFRERVLERAGSGADVPTLTQAYIKMGTGDYQGAIDLLSPGALLDDDAATFAYFHAIGLAGQYTPTGSAFLFEENQDRLEATWRDLQETRSAARVLVRHDPNLRPPWKVIRDRLNAAEYAAWADFMADPFETAEEIVRLQQ